MFSENTHFWKTWTSLRIPYATIRGNDDTFSMNITSFFCVEQYFRATIAMMTCIV